MEKKFYNNLIQSIAKDLIDVNVFGAVNTPLQQMLQNKSFENAKENDSGR